MMDIVIRAYKEDDLQDVTNIWNQIIRDSEGFLWKEVFPLGKTEFVLNQQAAVICAEDVDTKEVVGFYTLRSNNSGKGSHIANGLYGVKKDYRGNGVGKLLGYHSLQKAEQLGYEAMQYNSVISSNIASTKLWESLGFTKVGIIKDGYKDEENQYDDLRIYYKKLGFTS